MFDELERLYIGKHLFRLLAHYAQAGAADREAWQDRLMALDEVTGKELSRLHGELIAQGWIEQNTGVTVVLKLCRLGVLVRGTLDGGTARPEACPGRAYRGRGRRGGIVALRLACKTGVGNRGEASKMHQKCGC